MGKNRAYRATGVKKVSLEEAFSRGPDGEVTVGLDIGKHEVFAVLRWKDGSFLRPWKTRMPTEIPALIEVLEHVANERPLRVAMESTGAYGDALRQALTDANLNVHRVSGKATHDYAEIFDGVPSQHDGKDAAIIAELTALGKSWPWPYRPKEKQNAEMASWVDWLDAQPAATELPAVRHVHLQEPLRVYLDGRRGNATILKPGPGDEDPLAPPDSFQIDEAPEDRR